MLFSNNLRKKVFLLVSARQLKLLNIFKLHYFLLTLQVIELFQ